MLGCGRRHARTTFGGFAVAKLRVVRVAVERGILWIGDTAFPLRNISRVASARWEPVRRWRGAAGGLLAGLLVLAVLGATDATEWSGGSSGYGKYLVGGIALLALATALGSTLRLVVTLSRKTRHALVIEVAGTPYTVLTGADGQLVGELVHQITAATTGPAAEFAVSVPAFTDDADPHSSSGVVGSSTATRPHRPARRPASRLSAEEPLGRRDAEAVASSAGQTLDRTMAWMFVRLGPPPEPTATSYTPAADGGGGARR
ncbi:hypothetical protein Slala02_29890 [Streptomyces lavendulae subsp. lavendulae]|nr:hypothetical protein Slala01_33180 [Streptomyces lavendulae subsp. lavendulae]GLX27169.1 hypothetical protein Slala02_29890 [Streptomyces lavendulae subsp. lavendulae]